MYRTRTYEPGEVRRILRRASELQDAEKAPAPGGRPLTLEEIQALARDAGIDDALVVRAATGGEAPASPPPGGGKTNAFLGGPTRLSFERRVAGKVGPANHAQLVKLIRRTFGDAGNAQVLGDSVTWSTTQWGPSGQAGVGRHVSVSIDPEPDGVNVRIDENLRNLSGGLFGGLLGGGGGGGLGLILPLAIALFHTPAAIAPVCAVWFGLVYLLARTIYVGRVRARTAELSKLFDELVARVEEEPAKLEARPRVAASPAGGERDEIEADAGEAGAAASRGGLRS